MKEISIEDFSTDINNIRIEYYEHNDYKELTVPIDHLEDYVKQENLLGWSEMIIQNGVHVDDREGTWEFSEWVKERLNSDIVKSFLISELQRFKS